MAFIEYYYSAHSVFAYLGHARLRQIAARSGREIRHKPVDLNPVVAAVHPESFAQRSAAHRKYFFGREIERWVEFRGVPFRGGIPANHRGGAESANRMLIACTLGDGETDGLAQAFMQAHWADHADLSDPKTVATIARAAGHDADMLSSAASGEDVSSIYAENTAEAIERSVFGSPTYFIDGDMFYGQDRLDMVERALQKPFTPSPVS